MKCEEIEYVVEGFAVGVIVGFIATVLAEHFFDFIV